MENDLWNLLKLELDDIQTGFKKASLEVKGTPCQMNYRGFIKIESTNNSLSWMLMLMSQMPLVQPRFNEDIIGVYTKDLFKYNSGKFMNEFTQILQDIDRKSFNAHIKTNEITFFNKSTYGKVFSVVLSIST